jgi:hypothetical protein
VIDNGTTTSSTSTNNVFVQFAALVVLAPHANVVADGERFLFALRRANKKT